MNVYLIETTSNEHLVQASHAGTAIRRALSDYPDLKEGEMAIITVEFKARNMNLEQYLGSLEEQTQ